MQEIKSLAAKNWRKAFEIAIRLSVRTKRVPGPNGRTRVERSVALTDEERMDMFNFYRKYVKDDRAEAVQAIGLAAKQAVRKPPIVSCAIFLFFVVFILLNIFGNLWYPALALLIAALTIYLLNARTRRAGTVWKTRKSFKNDEVGTLERMCAVLGGSPFKCANLSVVGGLTAAILVAFYYSVVASVFG